MTGPVRGVATATKTIGRTVAKAWRAAGRFLDRVVTTKRKHVLIAALLLIFVYVSSQHQADTLAARSDARDRRDQAQATYLATLRAYDAQASQYKSCKTKVETHADLRALFFAMVDLSDLFPGAAGAEQYTESRDALIDEHYGPLILAVECGQPPTPPPVPAGVNP